jgi:pilus assembly protein CpaB
MRSKAWIMLVVAIVAGLAAVVLAARWMQQQGGSRTQVAVAAADIELGGRITPEMVRMVDWPQASIPPGAFNEAQPLHGRVVLSSLQRGEPILAGRLAPEGSKGGLSAVVGEGKRAMTVRVNDVSGVAGFSLPGTYVDIMVNTQEDGSRRDGSTAISKIVLERILVLAVAQEADRDTTKPKVVNAVTLEVSPEQAELLDLARSVGTLSLVLRNQSDPNAATTNGVSKSELLASFGAAPAPAPAPAPPAAPAKPAPRAKPAPPKAPVVATAVPARSSDCVEVIRGLAKVTECF